MLVGACTAGPPTVRGNIGGLQLWQMRAEPGPAPTVKSRNSAYNFANSLAAHCRGGALLHPKSLSAAHNAKKDPQVYRLQVLSLGAPSGTRTQGPLIKSQLLYQLS